MRSQMYAHIFAQKGKTYPLSKDNSMPEQWHPHAIMQGSPQRKLWENNTRQQ